MSLESLRNRFVGERVFLIGNGPSLEKTPLGQLKNEYSLAMNGINDLYSRTSWRPSFYILLLDELEKNYDEYLSENLNLGIECITLSQHESKFENSESIHYIKKRKLKSNIRKCADFHKLNRGDVQSLQISELYDFWSNDVANYVYTYHSMYAAIQIAVYLGFETIYLLGCDLGYGTYNPHMIFKDGLNPFNWGSETSYLLEGYREGMLTKSVIHGILFKILTSPIADLAGQILDYTDELDDSNRFSSHTQFQPEDLTYVNDEIEKSHIAAKRISSDQGVDIYNATVGGELEVYPRVSFEEIFDN